MDKTYVQFLWHFHQPYYSLPDQATNQLPWVRLHAIKSYYDMGRMLERHPDIRCAVNFSGSLLLQLREYVDEGKRDTWWELTQTPADQLDEAQRYQLLRDFFAIDWERHVEPLPRYRELLEKRGEDPAECDPSDFDVQELRDLQVLFNLAWFGFSAREERAVVQALLDKGRAYTESEKQAVLEQQIEVMQLVAPLYRKLHHRGQIELSITPMHHPILPLLLDTESAAVSAPDSPRPPRLAAPRDAHFHLTEARTIAREVLGVDPAGMWPAEGGVSAEAVDLFGVHDLDWIATDEQILKHSLDGEWTRNWDLYHPWHLEGRIEPQIFFRDAVLSDRIGFTYAASEAEEAVDDFLKRVRDIGAQRRSEAAPPVISVILDGENPWMHYPDDGQYFLMALYEGLAEADGIETITPSQYLAEHGPGPALPALHAGSWIDADFGIWIGGEETNRAWRLLGETREHLGARTDEELGGGDERDLYLAWRALYVAEASDWFWWYGDDFVSHNDADFDRLFRDQLRFVYQSLGEEPPADLEVPISRGGSARLQFEPPQSLIQPTIDGDNAFFYEWSGAGVYRSASEAGSSSLEGGGCLEEMRVGFDLGYLYVMIQPGPAFDPAAPDMRVDFEVVGPDDNTRRVEVRFDDEPSATVLPPAGRTHEPLRVAFQQCLELAVSFDSLGLDSGDRFALQAVVFQDEVELERHPADNLLELEVPDETFEMRHWIV